MKLWIVTEVRRRSGGACEAGQREVCRYRASHIHHKKLRSRGGSDDPKNLLHVCHACHDWIHGHPGDATELGWMTPSWAEEGSLPAG